MWANLPFNTDIFTKYELMQCTIERERERERILAMPSFTKKYFARNNVDKETKAL